MPLHAPEPEPSIAALGKAELVVALVLTAVLAVLHFRFALSAGALWRDEVACVNFANLPSAGEMWRNLGHESFPIGWFAVLRGWMKLGPGASDSGLRLLGLLVGLGIIGTLWRNARSFGASPPPVSLATLGFNSSVLVYGDSVRGHGLGMLTGLLTLGLFWDYLDKPSGRRLAVAALAALLAIHTLYFNVVLVFSACLAGMAVALARSARRTALNVALLGIVCALSLLPYSGAFRSRHEWSDTFRADVSLPSLARKLSEAFESTGPAAIFVWIALAVAAIAVAGFAWARRSADPEKPRGPALFCAITLVVGLPCYVVFLRALGFLSQPWYYVALMSLVAGCLDAPLSLLFRTGRGRMARLAVVVAVAALFLPSVWKAAGTRRTNVDLAARRLEAVTNAGDLVVINPWYLGLTFDRYYRGRADWVTVPPLVSHKLHRYDLLKAEMTSAGVMAPLLERIRHALREGHRVFWLGDFFVPAEGETVSDPPPAPNAPWGWADAPYYEVWGLQAGELIRNHARSADRLLVPAPAYINPFEDVAVVAIGGWWGGLGEAGR